MEAQRKKDDKWLKNLLSKIYMNEKKKLYLYTYIETKVLYRSQASIAKPLKMFYNVMNTRDHTIKHIIKHIQFKKMQ